jgi:hypothetical protein
MTLTKTLTLTTAAAAVAAVKAPSRPALRRRKTTHK